MKMKVELKPTKEWQEKDGDKVLNSLRIYVGSLHVATVEPVKGEPDKYQTHYMIGIVETTGNLETLEDIKLNIELSIKEFIHKVAKVERKLIPIAEYPEVMKANPSKRFNSPLKKDGNGNR